MQTQTQIVYVYKEESLESLLIEGLSRQQALVLMHKEEEPLTAPIQPKKLIYNGKVVRKNRQPKAFDAYLLKFTLK